jgi:hypothetical protein
MADFVNLRYVCYRCRKIKAYYYSNCTMCLQCSQKHIAVFKETKIPNPRDKKSWKKFFLNYEKSNEKEAASLFIDLYRVISYFREPELQRENNLKIILNKLKQASHEKNAFKHLKYWFTYSETKSIFLYYLGNQPRLCILLIEAGYVITEDIFLITLRTNILNKRHIDDYLELLSIMMKKLDLVSSNKKKNDELVLIGGEKPLRSESLSQNVIIIPNLTLIDHKRDTYLHNLINEMCDWLSSQSKFLNNPDSLYDYKVREIHFRAEGYMKTCKVLNEFIFSYVDSCTIARIATVKNAKNEAAITLGNLFKQNLKNNIKTVELLPIFIDLQNVIVEMLELFEKSIKQQKKIVSRKVKRNIIAKSINLEETVEDLKGCLNI